MNLREAKSRKLKVLFGGVGKGLTTKRISLPTRWVNDMEVDEENRDVILTQVSKALVITKSEILEEDYVKLEKILKKYV